MNSARKLTAVSMALAAGLAMSLERAASAQSLVWANAAGGTASTTTNWSPAQAPTAANDLIFNLAGAYTVTFNNLVQNSHTHVYRQGSVTVVASSPHTVSTGITVGNVSPDNATMALTTGTVTSTAPVIIGNASGSTGVLSVNDDDADLILTTAAGDLTVGSNGAGTLNITGVGHVQVADQLIAGNNSTSVSNLTVSGFLAVAPFGNSFLEVLGTSDSRIGQGGDATMTVSSGALASFAGNLIVGNGAASTSSITVQTQGLFDARLNVAGNVFLGRNISAGVAAGNATLTVNNGGAAVIGGELSVGADPDGGTGLLKIATGGSVSTHDLTVGVGGSVQHTGGTLTVNGGTYTQSTFPIVLSDPTGTPELVVTNGATALLGASGSPSFESIVIGGPGASADGLMRITAGGRANVTAVGSAVVAIGFDADDRGEFDIDGANSTFSGTPNTSVVVGKAGTGRLEITNGGQMTAATFSMATLAAGVSSVFVQDAGSLLRITQDLAVAGFVQDAGGTGQLFVRNGGHLDITANAVSAIVWPQGLISIDDSALDSVGIIDVFGSMGVENGGVVNAVQITVDDGQIGGDGAMNARILLTNSSLLVVGSALQPAPVANLVVGLPGTTAGFSSSGSSTIRVESGCSLTIQDLDEAGAEIIQLNGGTITALHGLDLHATANVSGNGLIDADVEFTSGGSISPSGAGLRFGGVITRSGGTMSGTTFGFNTGGGYTGNGTIAGIVDFDAGSVCTNTGILSIGNAANNFGVTLDGTLFVGNGTVTLLDANGVGLGTITDLAGGSLVCAQNLTVNGGRTIEGNGFVQAPLLTLLGSVKPADHPSQPPHRGTLNISGAVSMGVNNTYFCDIDPGIEFATSDRISSSGAATINGALNVAFIDGYTPVASHTFDVVVGSSRTGIFNSLTTPPLGSFGPAHVEYFPDRARLVFCYANCDGSVVSPTLNVNDFQCFLNRFAAGDAYANCDQSTIAPVLNVNDFQCFLNKFAAGCN